MLLYWTQDVVQETLQGFTAGELSNELFSCLRGTTMHTVPPYAMPVLQIVPPVLQPVPHYAMPVQCMWYLDQPTLPQYGTQRES
eukprot:3836203-Rhodomonas_salina.1